MTVMQQLAQAGNRATTETLGTNSMSGSRCVPLLQPQAAPEKVTGNITVNRATRRAAERAARRRASSPRTADQFAALRTLSHARARASAEPLDASQLQDLAIGYHGALSALAQGTGTWQDVNTLALAANVALLLCELGIGADEIEAVRDAQGAIVALERRAQANASRYVLMGVELRSLQALLGLHDAQLAAEECTEGVMVAALDEIKRRMTAGNTLR